MYKGKEGFRRTLKTSQEDGGLLPEWPRGWHQILPERLVQHQSIRHLSKRLFPNVDQQRAHLWKTPQTESLRSVVILSFVVSSSRPYTPTCKAV